MTFILAIGKKIKIGTCKYSVDFVCGIALALVDVLQNIWTDNIQLNDILKIHNFSEI